MPEYEEGDRCPGEGKCKGFLEYPPVENCLCPSGHPPCWRCVENQLACSVCGWEEEGQYGIQE